MPILSKSGLSRLLTVSLAAMCLAAPAAAVDDTAPAPVEVLPFTPVMPSAGDETQDLLRLGVDMADRMTVPVQISGLGPYPFIIDTGSHRSIVATELAKKLELQELAPVEIISMAGKETVASVRLNEMRFGNQVVNQLPALSIAHSDLGSAGLIGLDGLRDKRLTLDFRKRQMAIGKSSPAGLTDSDRSTIVVKARSKFGQLILVNSKIDGKRVNVILDTGAEISVGNMALFNSLKQQKLVVPPKTVTIRAVTGQTVEAQFSVVRKLHIDSVTLENVPMVFLDAAPFAELDLGDKPAMLLGMKMLRMFDRVAIDFGSRHVDFQLPQSRRGLDLRGQLLAAL